MIKGNTYKLVIFTYVAPQFSNRFRTPCSPPRTGIKASRRPNRVDNRDEQRGE